MSDEKLLMALRVIFKTLNSLKYDLEGGVYTLSDYEMSNVFYCRDTADKALQLDPIRKNHER